MRIPTLLEKINSLASQPESRTAIDVDLMLDYTRVLYADLLEWRDRIVASPIENKASIINIEVHSSPKEGLHETKQRNHSPIAESGVETSKAQKPSPQIDWLNAPQATSTQVKDIRSLIGINDKYQILSELFGNDKVSYEEALDYINQSEAEAEALNWLREQLWITEERSDAAQNFYEIVSRHFGP